MVKKIFLITAIVLSGVYISFAQGGRGSVFQPGDPGDGNPGAVPIGAVEILLLAGGALGVRKLIQRKDK